MPSVMVSVLLFAVMLLMVAVLIISAFHERRRCMRVLATQVQASSRSLQVPTKSTARRENGRRLSIDKSGSQPEFTLSFSWYVRRHTLVLLSMLLTVLLTFLMQSGLANDTLQKLDTGLSFLNASQLSTSNLSLSAHSVQYGNASKQLIRVSQLAPNQYGSAGEFHTWAYSACSAAAMTEIFNAYGRHYRVTDVLKIEAQIGEITPQLGLLEGAGIERTAAQFGFKTTWGNAWTIDRVIETANSGKPVIVSFPPDRYAGGHILDVIGGDSTSVYLADTSLWNRQSITRGQFLGWWGGYAAVVTPA